jgi:hypothetical protein
MNDTTTDASEGLRYVFIEKPRVSCPACGSESLRVTRSAKEDGAVRKTTNCLECGHHFFQIWE